MRRIYIPKTMTDMEIDAYRRATEENLMVEIVDEDAECVVHNLDHNTIYTVLIEGDRIVDCECPHHHYRTCLCKHMVAASWALEKLV